MSEEKPAEKVVLGYRSRVPPDIQRVLDALSASWQALEPGVPLHARFDALATLFSATRNEATLAELQTAILLHYSKLHYGKQESARLEGQVDPDLAERARRDLMRAAPRYRPPQADINAGAVRGIKVPVKAGVPMYAYHKGSKSHTVHYNFTSTVRRWYVRPDCIINFGTDPALPELPFDQIPTDWLRCDHGPSTHVLNGFPDVIRPQTNKEHYLTFYHKIIYTDIQVQGDSADATVFAHFEKT